MTDRIAIIGQGAFGSALAALFQSAGFEVDQYGREHPREITAAYLVLAVPTRAVAEVIARLTLSPATPLIFCSKGFLPDGRLFTSLIDEPQPFAVLSGPGFAQEIATGLPTVHTIAAASGAGALARKLSTPSFRLYASDDPVGVQVCGAFKNILAIAAGIADHLALGENARAALICRGLAELSAGLQAFGGDMKTALTPAGMGDLVLTCTSSTSRNFRCGQLIGGGLSPKEAVAQIGVVEGVGALEGFLAKVDAERAPICCALRDVFAGRTTPQDAIDALMTRPIAT